MLTTEIKQKIAEAIKAQAPNYNSYIKQGNALGVSASALSRFAKGELDGVISDANLIAIARKYDVPLKDEVQIITAKTAVFNHVWRQLEFAQQNSVSGILCDRADIGKTHTALAYARENKNVAYIDCGRYKTKYHFVRSIAKEFGLNTNALYSEIFENLVYFLKTVDHPLVILDEFGDLRYEADMEFKALWNATDKHCGWYAMGADGLRAKIERYIHNNKLGYAEIFSRLGNKFQRITPETEQDFRQFQKKQIAAIGLANKSTDIQKLHARTNMSLRRIPIQLGIERIKQEEAAQ